MGLYSEHKDEDGNPRPILIPDVAAVVRDEDIWGWKLAVGTPVRAFDFPMRFEDGSVDGLKMRGPRACYYEGVIEAIGDDFIEGCYRYRIKVSKHIFGGLEVANEREYIYPPLNGTRAIGIGAVCFGVLYNGDV